MKKYRRLFIKLARFIFIAAIAFTLFWGCKQIIKQSSFFGVYGINTSQKVVALTYDDGPNPLYTPKILDILARHHAKATFFVIGKNVESYPQIIKSIMQAGHELGNHSYHHKYMAFRSWAYLTSEVDKTERSLQNAGLAKTTDFRPPWGRRLFLLPLYLHQQHKRLVIWDVDSSDWDISYSTQSIVDKVMKLVKPGSIILMHDGFLQHDIAGTDRHRTIQATDIILTQLEQQNYRFVTVDELFNNYNKR